MVVCGKQVVDTHEGGKSKPRNTLLFIISLYFKKFFSSSNIRLKVQFTFDAQFCMIRDFVVVRLLELTFSYTTSRSRHDWPYISLTLCSSFKKKGGAYDERHVATVDLIAYTVIQNFLSFLTIGNNFRRIHIFIENCDH